MHAFAPYLDVPFAAGVLEDGVLIDWNKEFQELFGVTGNKPINELLPQWSVSAKEHNIAIHGDYYMVYTGNSIGKQESEYKIVYVIRHDYQPTGKHDHERTAVGLIFVDNFEEVTEGKEEIRPLIQAVVDRKLAALAQKIDGIVSKMERDKYIFIFSYDKLAYLKVTHFEILNEMRRIDLGNTLPITLSIGIGLNGKTLAHSMEYARAAMDLALGRGGDQVLIKNGDEYQFFGGKSKTVGNNTRVRARVKAYALSEMIEGADQVLVMGHRNGDLDCFGAAIGIYKIARSLDKPCQIVLNSVTTNIKLLYERILELPSYRQDVFISSQQALEKNYDNLLLVVVDCHRPSILELPALLSKPVKTVVFDHHRKSAEYIENAVLTYHEPYASSTCELITEMLQYLKNEVRLLPVEADALLAGITMDTKNFAFKTGAKTFDAAAYLKRNGADSIRVRILFQNDMESYQAKMAAVSQAEVYHDNLAIAVCTAQVENPSLTCAQASDDLLNITGIKASFVLCEHDETVLISARSLDEINVQMIMEKLGGGGHQTVAGAQLANFTTEEAVKRLKEAVDQYRKTNGE